MAYQLWSQDNFSKGELSPYMYARAQVQQYYNGLKTAQNVLTYPTGAAGKRFGTLYQAPVVQGSGDPVTDTENIYFQTFQYLDQCTYQLVFTPGNISIYLEGRHIANRSTSLVYTSVTTLTTTTLGSLFRVTGRGFHPKDLIRSADAGTAVTVIGPNSVVAFGSAIFTLKHIVPVYFEGTIPGSDPQISPDVTYFAAPVTTSSALIYTSAYNAKFNIDNIDIADTALPVLNMFIENTWTFSDSVFKNLPYYDFNGPAVSYDSITFTPASTSGASVVITLSAPYAPLTVPSAGASQYIGGAFFGGGGSSRIISVADTTHFTVAVQTPFNGNSSGGGPILGTLAFLAQPAWSDARGWPQKCSSYQNRAIFANSDSLPNGFWTSVINDYTDFGDLTSDDDDAISWYPSSNEVNVIRFIVPFRSITVHTNSGIYSSPLSEISAITPSTFTLQLQDSTPASVLIPQAIDNQIIVISGNDVHTMLWDGINNAYTSNIVSIANEQLIRDPVDETAFADLTRAGSRYVFIVNANGSMAVYQTLLSEVVSGFTPQIMEQSYGSAKFLQVASSSDGRCWFIVQRDFADEQAPLAITDYGTFGLKAIGSNFSTTTPTAITFTTTGTLPATTTTPLEIDRYYWAIGRNVADFDVYLTQEDAINLENKFVFTSAGTSSNVVAWPLTAAVTLEELSQDVHLDCAVEYGPRAGSLDPEIPTDTVNTDELFNAQAVKMIGDGYGFDAIGFNDEVVFEAHGEPVEITNAYIGFPINLVIEPMPLSPPPAQNTSLTKPNHIRSVRFMFNNTIGGTINGVPISLEQFDQVEIGVPPIPARGVFEMMITKGWDDFNNPSFTIEHNEPFNIELIGVFYSVDT